MTGFEFYVTHSDHNVAEQQDTHRGDYSSKLPLTCRFVEMNLYTTISQIRIFGILALHKVMFF